MKQLLCALVMLSVLIPSFSQSESSIPNYSKPDYALKSKKQKTNAWTLLGGGTGLIVGGYLVANTFASSFTDGAIGGVLMGVGVISVLGSVPLFVSSGINHRRSIGRAQIRLQSCPSLTQSQGNNKIYLAAHFNISL